MATPRHCSVRGADVGRVQRAARRAMGSMADEFVEEMIAELVRERQEHVDDKVRPSRAARRALRVKEAADGHGTCCIGRTVLHCIPC